MTTNTLHIHRVLTATPDRVYRAFITPAAMCKWLPPHGFTGVERRPRTFPAWAPMRALDNSSMWPVPCAMSCDRRGNASARSGWPRSTRAGGRPV